MGAYGGRHKADNQQAYGDKYKGWVGAFTTSAHEVCDQTAYQAEHSNGGNNAGQLLPLFNQDFIRVNFHKD
jgi:hypothetical protein